MSVAQLDKAAFDVAWLVINTIAYNSRACPYKTAISIWQEEKSQGLSPKQYDYVCEKAKKLAIT